MRYSVCMWSIILRIGECFGILLMLTFCTRSPAHGVVFNIFFYYCWPVMQYNNNKKHCSLLNNKKYSGRISKLYSQINIYLKSLSSEKDNCKHRLNERNDPKRIRTHATYFEVKRATARPPSHTFVWCCNCSINAVVQHNNIKPT